MRHENAESLQIHTQLRLLTAIKHSNHLADKLTLNNEHMNIYGHGGDLFSQLAHNHVLQEKTYGYKNKYPS